MFVQCLMVYSSKSVGFLGVLRGVRSSLLALALSLSKSWADIKVRSEPVSTRVSRLTSLSRVMGR